VTARMLKNVMNIRDNAVINDDRIAYVIYKLEEWKKNEEDTRRKEQWRTVGGKQGRKEEKVHEGSEEGGRGKSWNSNQCMYCTYRSVHNEVKERFVLCEGEESHGRPGVGHVRHAQTLDLLSASVWEGVEREVK
jgi:hypothetical protein